MPTKIHRYFLLVIAIFLGIGAVILKSSPLYTAEAQKPIDFNTLTGTYNKTDTQGVFHEQAVASRDLPDSVLSQKVLGDSDEPKHIEVDLSAQRLYAFEGDHKVYDFLISSGKWNKTPTGTFHIWGKFRYTKMEGGNPRLHTYYYLPNVPYVMFFSNDQVAASDGFSLHGTYWHSNFGHPMSHGCVNMKTEEAAIIYDWSQPNLGGKRSTQASADNPGTEIRIYGEAPKE